MKYTLALLLVSLVITATIGCSGSSGPVTPVESDRTPSDAVPDPGEEPELQEKGP